MRKPVWTIDGLSAVPNMVSVKLNAQSKKKKKKRAQNDVDFDLLANENGNIGPLGVQSPSFLRLGC